MPSCFREFLGNQELVAHFLKSAQRNCIPPVALLAGPEGVGKKTFALLAAQYLNCRSPLPGDVCAGCTACLKISRRVHPDVRLIAPEGSQIKIEQMRELSSDLQFRPFEGKRKVYVIDEAEKLNESATNSILKTLEECPYYAWIALVTAHPATLRPTIRSRCSVSRFGPVESSQIENLLRQRGEEEAKARVLSRLSGGSIAEALKQDWDQIEKERGRALSLLDSLSRPESFHGVRSFWTKLTTEERTRQRLEDLFRTLLVLLRDMLMLKEGRPSEVVHFDIIPRLEKSAALYSFATISELERQIRVALQEAQRNLNPQILLESLYFESAPQERSV
ncbi:MAG: hypothetical protein HY644_10780 [Acidobacteria bacterium]|nr:hypothetical protein [Acidobacteriota bacterium]